MGRKVDPEEGLREMLDLWSAETADALHRALVLYPPIRASANHSEPLALLQHHHATEPGTSPTTAMLLLTDRRWRSAVGPLARAIGDSGILSDEHLDLLATAVVAAADAVFWQVPDAWFANGATITLGPRDDDHEGPDRADDDTGDPTGSAGGDHEPERLTVARRDLPPPLRRWATTHAIRRDRSRWGTMITRARDLSAPHAAATLAGLMDAIDALEPPAQTFVVDRALASRDHGVRWLALRRIAQNGDVDKAHALAKDDPNRRIRDWADDLRQPSPHDGPHGNAPDNGAQPHEAPPTHRRKPPPPPTLF